MDGATSFPFRLTRWDLYNLMRLAADERPFRKVAPWLVALFAVAMGVSEGDLPRGLLWGALAVVLFQGASHLMFALYAFGMGNETLLAPQTLNLSPERIVVEGEGGRDAWELAAVEGSCRKGAFLVVRTGGDRPLILPLTAFDDPEAIPALERSVAEAKANAIIIS